MLLFDCARTIYTNLQWFMVIYYIIVEEFLFYWSIAPSPHFSLILIYNLHKPLGHFLKVLCLINLFLLRWFPWRSNILLSVLPELIFQYEQGALSCGSTAWNWQVECAFFGLWLPPLLPVAVRVYKQWGPLFCCWFDILSAFTFVNGCLCF